MKEGGRKEERESNTRRKCSRILRPVKSGGPRGADNPDFLTPIVTECQVESCSPQSPSKQNSGGQVLVIKERSLYSKATQFWNNSFPHTLIT